MKFRNYFVLFVLVLFFALISTSGARVESVAQPTPEEKLQDKIDRQNGDLKEKFSKKDFKGMADVLGDNTIVVKPNGQKIKTWRKIKNFWKEKRSKWDKVTIQRKYTIMVPREFVINGVKYAHIGIEISEFVFESNPNSEFGEIMHVWMHREECEWDG
jgi:hypothetical protein